MYNHPQNRSRTQGRPQFRGRFSGGGRGNGGRHVVRTFDPTLLVRNTPVRAESSDVFVPTHSFADFAISEELKKNIAYKGYTEPTPIQDQVIIPIIEGRDIIGIANTGTGKTAGFLIPLINKVLKDPTQRVLIVAPTRELANQIKDEFISFARGMRMYAILCMGGTNMYKQRNDFRHDYNFVIGTPGRIKDMIETGLLNLSTFQTVVLDEADHMVDIGFIQDIKYIISLIPKTRQSLFFSATIDGKVREVLNSFVQNPVTVSVKKGETAENIEQDTIKIIDSGKKIEQLHELLIQKEFDKVLIFGRTKWGVQKLSDELVKRGFRADAIHGNKRQNQRIRTLEKFKNSEIQILLATDVASRGLDIPNVSHVINYDLPESYDAYVHRIGRTGRADKKGIALTFVD
jgi:superfamily II DNA/RNA helicase